MTTFLYVVAFITAVVSEYGVNDYTYYQQGNSPLLFLATHGGYEEPETIPMRHDGCFVDGECDWTNGCAEELRSSTKCSVKLLRDSYTQEIATCLSNTVQLKINGQSVTNHLVINKLARNRMDANRKIGEAAMGNSFAENAWHEIHDDDTSVNDGKGGWLYQAKIAAMNKCGFGVMFDIHGQASNAFNQFGYRLSKTDLGKTDLSDSSQLKNYQQRDASVYNLAFDVYSDPNRLEDIVRGDYSLGTLLENKLSANNGNGEDYLVFPSMEHKNVPNSGFTYYPGGFALRMHGSSKDNELDGKWAEPGYPTTKSSVVVDVVQIEINSDIRLNKNGADRDQFCIDFSQAIEEFIEHWYDLSQCQNANAYETKDGSNADEANGSFVFGNTEIGILGGVLILCSVLCGLFLFCRISKKKKRKNMHRKSVDVMDDKKENEGDVHCTV